MKCRHDLTAPAKQKRWRICMECGQLVHRCETTHYWRLFR